MRFEEALKIMKDGNKVKLPSWGGFWKWDSEKESIIMHTKDGEELDMYLGMQYVDRGYVTQDEYENLRTYLYDPYKKLGGNGSAERVMKEVDKLPIHKFAIGKEEKNNEHE